MGPCRAQPLQSIAEFLTNYSRAVKLSVGNAPRHHCYGNLVNKSLGHIAHALVVQGFIFDNSNKPVGTENFTEIQQFCNRLY